MDKKRRGGTSMAIVVAASALVAAVFFIGGIGFESPRNIEFSVDSAQAETSGQTGFQESAR